jgi:hypothetical protein
MTHADRVQAAKDAINAVFSDTSVPQETTLESLRELRDELDIVVDCVEQDLARAKESEA